MNVACVGKEGARKGGWTYDFICRPTVEKKRPRAHCTLTHLDALALAQHPVAERERLADGGRLRELVRRRRCQVHLVGAARLALEGDVAQHGAVDDGARPVPKQVRQRAARISVVDGAGHIHLVPEDGALRRESDEVGDDAALVLVRVEHALELLVAGLGDVGGKAVDPADNLFGAQALGQRVSAVLGDDLRVDLLLLLGRPAHEGVGVAHQRPLQHAQPLL